MLTTYDRMTDRLCAVAPAVLPTLSRLVFAGVLLFYFWSSALTKLGPGLFGFLRPSDGAYIQIFPKVVEAAGYDFAQLGLFHRAVVVAGVWAEFLLPLLIVIGLLTRFTALGMIGFVVVQSLTDVYGHGVAGDDLGHWFDAMSASLILDQRGLWGVLLLTLVFLGAGPVSLDRLLARSRQLSHPAQQS